MSVSIRLLVVSDTHGEWPYNTQEPAPKADILLHCGDLTQVGGLASFKRAIEDIKTIDAELKLVIAGNHDLELDESWVRRNMEDPEELEESVECISYMNAQKQHGIYYLSEGLHKFQLQDGRVFTVYASPYTPEFNGYAFAYGDQEDRFNQGESSIPTNVDIVMTHGPPAFDTFRKYTLDENQDGHHCGCGKLAKAIRKTQPRLHCFGHIHEGRGAIGMDWKDEGKSVALWGERGEGSVLRVEKGAARNQTLFVNAAIHKKSQGLLVDMEL
jgi:Icc-related predicted phosphoesterase